LHDGKALHAKCFGDGEVGSPAKVDVGIVFQHPLTHWDGDTFTCALSGENAPPGTISKAIVVGTFIQ
jgi:hypothetical protein